MRTEWRENLLRNLSQAESISALISILLEAVRVHGAELETDSPEERGAYTSLILSRIQALSKNSAPKRGVVEIAQFYRLIELGDLLLIRTDPEFRVTEVHGNTERLLGVTHSELISEPLVWRRFLEDRDLRALRLMLRSASLAEDLSAEVKVVNRVDGLNRWLLVKGVPLLSDEGQLIGFEGFGLDITERYESQQDLLAERRRLNALYEVSRAVQVSADPAMASLKGIRALRDATSSDCALACFYDDANDLIELVACEGFSEQSVQDLSVKINGPSIARTVITEGRGFAIEDLESHPGNAAVSLTHREGLKSAIFAPLVQDGRNLGCIALFSRRRARYQDADNDLLNATVQQLSSAIRTAEGFSAERRQANVVSTLYQLSHELSRVMTPREMAAHAFPIIQGELACKRMWLGTLNDQGSHLVGQAGQGPGVRRSIIDLQINLSEAHQFLDEVIRTKEPLVISAGAPMECSTLNRLVSRLELGVLVLVPLVSLGKVVGVILLEPAISSMLVVQRKLPLLKNMAGEIATIILARRFEGKMAESDKMRMAGVLASGVAHNFNNLLQAVMGQASLIEMQLPQDSPLVQSTRMILDSAGKGASLIKQLMSFSMQGNSVRKTLTVNALLGDSKELFQSLLGSRIQLGLQLADGVPPIYADQGQLQQVVTNLLMNAKEAIADQKNGQVQLTTSEIRVRPGELDPELAPGIYVRLEVQDNGSGMDAERLARCFEPFYTTKDLDVRTGVGLTGSGLGLSSSYSIIKQHEGLITARSRPGEGSVFSVYLPALTVRSEDQPRETSVSTQPSSSLNTRGSRALLLGLNRSERELAAKVLGEGGLHIEALPYAEQLSEQAVDKVSVLVVQIPTELDRSGVAQELAIILKNANFEGTLIVVCDGGVLPRALEGVRATTRVVVRGELEGALGQFLRNVTSGAPSRIHEG